MQRHPFRLLTWALVFLVACTWPLSGAAQELCGIDDIFNSGFEVLSSTPLTSQPGALFAPGTAQSIVGPGTFSITITDPPDGTTVPGSTTPVAGTFSGPTNTGITVNGVIAHLSGTHFMVPSVAVANTSTALTATATKMTGETTTATSHATGGATPSPVALTLTLPAGFAPFNANFSYTIGTLTAGGVAQYIGIDADGDGTDDIVGPAAGVPVAFLQTQPGLYHARLTVRDNNNVTYTAYVYYIVRATSELNGMLCDVYGYMKQQLTAPGGPFITNALNAVHPNSQSDYQSMFTSAGSSLPTYVANLGSVATGTISSDFVSYLVVRQNPDQTLSGYHMEFTQDGAGVWRIGDM